MAQPVTVKEGWGAVAAAGSEGREGAAGPGAPFLGRFSAVHAVHLRRLRSMVANQKSVGFKTWCRRVIPDVSLSRRGASATLVYMLDVATLT